MWNQWWLGCWKQHSFLSFPPSRSPGQFVKRIEPQRMGRFATGHFFGDLNIVTWLQIWKLWFSDAPNLTVFSDRPTQVSTPSSGLSCRSRAWASAIHVKVVVKLNWTLSQKRSTRGILHSCRFHNCTRKHQKPFMVKITLPLNQGIQNSVPLHCSKTNSATVRNKFVRHVNVGKTEDT